MGTIYLADKIHGVERDENGSIRVLANFLILRYLAEEAPHGHHRIAAVSLPKATVYRIGRLEGSGRC